MEKRVMSTFTIVILIICCLLLKKQVACSIIIPRLKCDSTIDIAIVGAGVSGTYIAYRLRKTSKVIALFEYSDRIGGRLFTTTLPNAPDVKIELGGMRFIEGKHNKLHSLVEELNLTSIEFEQRLGRTARTNYFLRGQILSSAQVNNGDVPYNLSAQEKLHIHDLPKFYLTELVGSIDNLTDLDLSKTKDGIELNKLTLNTALDKVATPEGKQFLKDTEPYDSAFDTDASAVDYFLDSLTMNSDGKVLTVNEGMSSIPQTMAKIFLQSSNRHTIFLNSLLQEIYPRSDGYNMIKLHNTQTINGVTKLMKATMNVCAKSVIMAIPQFAMTKLKWGTIRRMTFMNALHAVQPTAASKVFLSFPTEWWIKKATNPAAFLISDAHFRHMYNWKESRVSSQYFMLASYAETKSAAYQERLNNERNTAPGSSGGLNRVSNRLKNELINQLAQGFKINRELVPEPTGLISQFWSQYPYMGGWTVWRAGFNCTETRKIIQRPSLVDNVFIVGADHARIGTTSWIEGALNSVNEVLTLYQSVMLDGK